MGKHGQEKLLFRKGHDVLIKVQMAILQCRIAHAHLSRGIDVHKRGMVEFRAVMDRLFSCYGKTESDSPERENTNLGMGYVPVGMSNCSLKRSLSVGRSQDQTNCNVPLSLK